jgi:hypothetical protein
MNFDQLLELVEEDPVFESSLFMTGEMDPAAVRLQLTRWTKGGRLYQLRRGLYALAPPYQKVKPHPFNVANWIRRASYVSCQSALAYYGLIPEYVPVTVSVTTMRPCRLDTSLGKFEFRHINLGLFREYRKEELGGRQHAFLATPEKALLDLIHLEPGSDSPEYLRELRLQNLGQLNLDNLRRMAREIGTPKMRRVVKQISDFTETESEEYETL